MRSGFGGATTAAEIVAGIDLTGKTYVVTGGYSGIGLETVRALVGAGASVVVPARSRVKAEAAVAGIDRVTVADMDLANLASVRRFAADFVAAGTPLDGLINNAGVMACPLQRIGDGWEYQFAVCHLGHFELARGLLASLKKANGSRVVALSVDRPCAERRDLGRSQLRPPAVRQMGGLWPGEEPPTRCSRWGPTRAGRGRGVRAFAVHPGGIFTPLQRHLPDEEMVALGWKAADGTIPPAVAAMFKTPEAGAATTVWCAVSQQLDGMGGLYCEDCDVAPLATPGEPAVGACPGMGGRPRTRRAAVDDERGDDRRLTRSAPRHDRHRS